MKYTNIPFLMIAIMVTVICISCGGNDNEDSDYDTWASEQTEQSDGLPTGWYNSGVLEDLTSRHVQEFMNFHDYFGLEREDWANYCSAVVAIHVINGSTFESVVGGASLSRPNDYFGSKTFSGGGNSYTLYWYFNYPLEKFTSRPSGKWYSNDGRETNAPKYSNGSITWGNNTYKKMNYTPKNW